MKINKEEMEPKKTAGNGQEEIRMDAESVGAISQQQIDEWKKEYGKIYQTVIGENVFIWRRVRRKEYVDAIVSAKDSEDVERRMYDRQEAVMKTVCLYPGQEELEKLIDEEGCLATCLGNEIMERSGFALPVTSQIV